MAHFGTGFRAFRVGVSRRNINYVSVEMRTRTIAVLMTLAMLILGLGVGFGTVIGKTSAENIQMREIIAPKREIRTGPRGGQFYINFKGNKVYVTP